MAVCRVKLGPKVVLREGSTNVGRGERNLRGDCTESIETGVGWGVGYGGSGEGGIAVIGGRTHLIVRELRGGGRGEGVDVRI